MPTHFDFMLSANPLEIDDSSAEHLI